MRKDLIIKSMIFVLAMSLEIRVNANSGVIEKPQSCLKSTGFCSVYVDSFGLKKFKIGPSYLNTLNKAIFIRPERKKIELVKGTFKLSTEQSDLSVSSEFGQVFLQKNSSVILKKTSKNIEIYPIKGVVAIKKPEDKRLSVLPTGMTYEISFVNNHGKSDTSLPKMANIADVLMLWRSLDNSKKSVLRSQMKKYTTRWKYSFHDFEKVFKPEVKREITAYAKERLRKERERNYHSEEDARLSRLFKERHYLNN